MNLFNRTMVSAVTASEKRAANILGGSLFSLGFGGATTPVGKKVTRHTSLKISGFWCAVNTIANTVALLPKNIYQKNNGTRERLDGHPLDYVIYAEPNERMTAFTFWFIMTVAMLVNGNAYALIVRDAAGDVISLKFLYPDDVTVLEKGETLYYRHKGVTYFSRDIYHIPLFSLDGVVGRSVIQYAADNLGVSLAGDEFVGKTYENKGMTQGVIEVGGVEISAHGQKALKTTFEKNLSTGGVNRVTVLDEGMKYKNIALSPAETQFIETKASGVEDIARWFQIPLHKLHAKGEGGYNFLVQMSIEYLQSAIQPIGQRIKQEGERKLLLAPERKQGIYVNLNYKKLLEADPKARGEFYKTMVNIKAMNPNEVRELEDMNPYEGGDEFLQMVNMRTQEQIKKELQDE